MPRFARPDTRTVYLRYRAVWGMLRESLEAVVAEAGWRPVFASAMTLRPPRCGLRRSADPDSVPSDLNRLEQQKRTNK
jgi:hypothetical protein